MAHKQNDLLAHSFHENFLLVKIGSTNIPHVGATIKRLMVEKEHCTKGSFFQVFRADVIASVFQIEAALEQSLSAFSCGSNFVKQPDLEFLLRLAATRDLDSALGKVGLCGGEQDVCILVFAHFPEECGNVFSRIAGILSLHENPLQPEDYFEKNFAKNKGRILALHGISVGKISDAQHGRFFAEALAVEETALLSRSG